MQREGLFREMKQRRSYEKPSEPKDREKAEAVQIPRFRLTFNRAMAPAFDPADYSVVVKNRARPPTPWRWEIYRAGRQSPVARSSSCYALSATATAEGKAALAQLLRRLVF